MFVDRVKLLLKAGKGGDGVVAWRREKYLPKGGPCGGNGGKGGDIYFISDAQVPSLQHFRNKRILKAENGGNGGPNCRQGRNGKEIHLKVPCGTLLKDVGTGEILFDFTTSQEKFLLCRGGKGGKGNTFFKSPTNRAPVRSTPGRTGEEREVELELKLIADVGLVGFPNAGKSTFMEAVTQVPVKIAPYPFTTLHPNLGYLYGKEGNKLLLADIPGIIEGASQNRGLGIEFLRHIERTSVLLFVLDASGFEGRDPISDFQVLQRELASYDPSLLEKPILVALNKIDLAEENILVEKFKTARLIPDDALFEISAKEKWGLPALISQLLLLKSQADEVDHACKEGDSGACGEIEFIGECEASY